MCGGSRKTLAGGSNSIKNMVLKIEKRISRNVSYSFVVNLSSLKC